MKEIGIIGFGKSKENLIKKLTKINGELNEKR